VAGHQPPHHRRAALTIEAVWPDLKTFFVPSTLGPLLLAYGVWVGFRAVRSGAGYWYGILAAVLLGILPIVLDYVGFGMILNRGTQVGLLSGIFSWAVIVFGALLGGGFATSGERAAAR
jgi:hypothetical protein